VFRVLQACSEKNRAYGVARAAYWGQDDFITLKQEQYANDD